MLRRPDPALLPQVPALDDDPGLFDVSPEWFIPGLKLSPREEETDDAGLGLRSLIEHPETLAKAWRTTRQTRAAARADRHKRRHTGRSLRWSHAA